MSLWNRNTYYSDYCDKPNSVYRLYDQDDNLLYVGMALIPLNRIPAHRRKPWGAAIVRHTIEWYPDRESAKAAERAAIHHENPIHNLVRPRMECC